MPQDFKDQEIFMIDKKPLKRLKNLKHCALYRRRKLINAICEMIKPDDYEEWNKVNDEIYAYI